MIQLGGGVDRNRAIHDALSKTVQEINNHAEIVSILEEIVTDIETAHSLELQLYQERLQADLQERYQWATEALEEYKAMEKEKEYTSQKVGELFLHDLMLLEDKLEAMTSIVPCQNMTDNSCHVDPLSSNDLQQTSSSPPPPPAPLPPQEGIISNNDDIVQESKETSRDESLPLTDSNHELASSMMEQPNTENQKDENDNDDKKDIQIQQPVEIDEMTANAKNAGQIPESTRLQAGVLPTKRNKITPNLQYLKSGLLMKIFEYMDAIDIVNMAQANVSLYTKINNIFGLGGTIVAGSRYVDDDDIDENYQSDEEDLPPVVVIDNNDEEEAQQQEENNPQHESTSKDSVKSSSDGQKATIVAIPVVKSSSSVAAKHDFTSSVNLPPDTTTKTLRSVDAKANLTTSKPRTTTTTTPAAAGFQMSASVAQSLASKLLPAELSAIIAMRDQLRKKEEDLQRAQEDVSDLTAQLEGTISVKEVLASKLKDLQKKVESDEEISAKMTRQVASDQEVIAFLDERVQELEKAVDNFHMERTKANKAIDKVKDASERQVAVLSDMLTYEREQRADQEKEWKSTKKVLIKEVKLCRAQIMALEAERDGFREENQRLKEALMALGAGAKAGRSFDTIMS